MVKLYCITCRENGKMYVGKTSRSLRVRVAAHIDRAKRESKIKFHRALIKYGPSNFDIVELFAYPTDDAAAHAESVLIDILDLTTTGYNSASGGSSPMLGRTHSLEARAKISAALRARVRPPVSAEGRARMRDAQTGKKLTDSHKAKLSAFFKGRPNGTVPQERRDRISASLKGRKIVFSDSHRAAISASQKLRGIPPAQKAKMLSASLATRLWKQERGSVNV